MLNESVIANYKNAIEKDGFLYLGNRSLKDYYMLTLEEVIELNERVGIPTVGFAIGFCGKGEQLNLIGKEDKTYSDAIDYLKKIRFTLPFNEFELLIDYLYGSNGSII